MEKYLFDELTNAFYPVAMKRLYEDAGINLDEAMEVDEKTFAEYSGEPPKGKIRIVGQNKLPAWGNVPPPSKEELITSASLKKASMLAEAQSTISLWQTELQLGIISDDDKASLIMWMKYIQALNAVDTSTAPDIEWPVKPE
ncbi:tail fiber assembly protein [Enterobacter hormaechei]|uniref:tail fiber assembly protein n=1 Tax=Enterobacter hormaechei TaxID=158836 RepID=UPI0022DE5F39|nr:tail fiber assembly protein [Enterobacter hormaechei]WBM57431.1 tail fiber assembly protein [Enterobacter hormaechei]